MSAPANLKPHHDIQGTTVNWVGGEPCLACCVCDNYQQAMNTRSAPPFLLQPMQYSPVCGHMGSQCFDEGDHGNWADRWFHGTRVGHTGPGYPSTRVLTSVVTTVNDQRMHKHNRTAGQLHALFSCTVSHMIRSPACGQKMVGRLT